MNANSKTETSTFNFQTLSRFKPEYGEHYVENGLDAMYTGNAPTMKQVRDLLGDNAINEWLKSQIEYMFELTDINLNPNEINSTIRLIRVKYQWLKLTEFMHYVFLFRTGEFGKIYGKANGQTVMLTLKDYCKIRDERIIDIRLRTESEDIVTKNTIKAVADSVLLAINSKEILSLGVWRKEPWASILARAYFVDHRMPVFPGDITKERREAFAREYGWEPKITK